MVHFSVTVMMKRTFVRTSNAFPFSFIVLGGNLDKEISNLGPIKAELPAWFRDLEQLCCGFKCSV